ncbi:MAG: LPS biosynthesis protein [Rickettsiales bacterium]|nr:LPS biosynthesis protein [Rickettsiales bacterium]
MKDSNKKLLKKRGKEIQVCTNCIYDLDVPGIFFDKNGVCNYCNQILELKSNYGTGKELGKEKLSNILIDIKRAGQKKKYDCIIGVSGGTDSSYLLYLAKKKWKLRPLAVHFDNTFNSSIATMNIAKVLKILDIDLYTYVVNNKEMDDIFRSFFKAGVPEIEASTDLALAEVMYRAANKYNISYILEGHSFVEEGITPLNKNYFDGMYIKDIHKQFGTMKMQTYPLMTLSRFLYWTCFKKIKKIRPFWYIEYSKEEAQKFLKKNFKWKYYGGHHLENIMTSFYHKVYNPQKFNVDLRNNTLSAQVRSKKMSRTQAWKTYNKKITDTTELIEYFQKRLSIKNNEYNSIMNARPKCWKDYKTYKKIFERMRLLFLFLSKRNLVPYSFYLKYCK